MARLCLRSGRKVPDTCKVCEGVMFDRSEDAQIKMLESQIHIGQPNSHTNHSRIGVLILAAVPEAYKDMLRSEYSMYNIYGV